MGVSMFTSMALMLLVSQAQPAPAASPVNPWSAVQFMVGEWEGASEGEPGKGTVKRSYRFVLGGKFLYEQNVSTYPPQPKNPKGEVHEHCHSLATTSHGARSSSASSTRRASSTSTRWPR